MENIYWTFSSKVYEDINEFINDLKEYQEDIMEEDWDEEDFNPEEKVIDEGKIQLMYEAWIKSEKDLLKNERLAEDEELDEDDKEYDMWQVEVLADLKADNGKSFTMAELLFKAHNQQANKELGDHIFFEGFEEMENDEGETVYYIICGS